ncbi:hypothetical protein HKX48_001786 [Thoreauomyces humboldtii]|nr:hypothetical protein HKX48_001786 [Thoreauomyces humboldtii]
MLAYRYLCLKPNRSGLNGPDDFHIVSGSDDDGERYGGSTILRVLEKYGCVDVCVVVSRWYGGQMLGPIRFRHIEETTLESLKVGGWVGKPKTPELPVASEELVKKVVEKDVTIATLRGTLRDLMLAAGDETVSPEKPSVPPSYQQPMTLVKVERLIKARDMTIAAVSKRIDEVRRERAERFAAAVATSSPPVLAEAAILIEDQDAHVFDPMSLLGDICSVDMSTMSDCKTYVATCGNSTVAAANPQCTASTSTLLPSIPTTAQATQNIKNICTEMSMPGCDTCTITSASSTYPSNNCDLLATYSLLCKAMPSMSQCAGWSAMCAATPGLTYCPSTSSSSSDPPVMRMYFHGGIVDYVLFESWVPRTKGQYAGAWIAIFLFAIAYEGWNATVATYEAGLLADFKSRQTIRSKSGFVGIEVSPPWSLRIKRGVVRGVAKLVTVTAAYALMLIAMTFNVLLFVAVVLGLAVGSAVFNEWAQAAIKAAVMNESGQEELCC